LVHGYYNVGRTNFNCRINLLSTMERSQGRPAPTSCQSCRSKKLRCNRVSPCSNCTARGVACTFLVPPRRQTDTGSTQTNAELRARIERLESLLQSRPFSADSVPRPSTDDSPSRQLALTPRSHLTPMPDVHQGRDEDSLMLENVGTREDSIVCIARRGERLPHLSCLTPA
jgi:ribosomal protein S12 methylthiotransferase accessory factor YcaO